MTMPLATIAARMVTVTCSSFPRSLDKLDRLLSEGTVPTQVVAAVLASDPMLAAQMLGEANATASSDITQLSAAMMNIGLGSVHGLIRGCGAIPADKRQEMAACWSQANACATMTRIVAVNCGNRLRATYDEETLQAAGLIHDLGTIIAILHFPDDYARACRRLDAGEGTLNQLLKQELGADCAQLGTLLARIWRLPPMLATCIRYHQHPMASDSFQEIACMVHVARILARACGFTPSRDRFLDPLDEQAIKRLDLHTYDLERIIDLFFEEMDELELYEGMLGAKTALLPIIRG